MSGRAYASDGFHFVQVDGNDPQIRALADILVNQLLGSLGDEVTIGVLLVGLCDVLSAVLVMDTPMPEQNSQAISTMLDNLKVNVMAHAQQEPLRTTH